MQWKRVLCCTLQFLHCDWFFLPLLSVGHCGVMDKWLNTHARGRVFKPSSCSYLFSSFKGKLNWFYWIWRQLRALKTLQTTSSYAMGKMSFLLHFTISYVSNWFLLPLLSAGHCGVMDKWLDTHARGRGFKPSSWSCIFHRNLYLFIMFGFFYFSNHIVIIE